MKRILVMAMAAFMVAGAHAVNKKEHVNKNKNVLTTIKENNITKTALMIIGDVVGCQNYDRSKLYDPGFTTEFREATK